jgi:hypothetical protein
VGKEEFYNCYFATAAVRITKLRRMIWTGRGEITYEDKVLVGKPESRL